MVSAAVLSVVLIFFGAQLSHSDIGPCAEKDEIPCDDSECIKRVLWCDSFPNCKDKSDEKYCRTISWLSGRDPNNCEGTHFICGNGQCVPNITRCDGYKDCNDASDEEKCITTIATTVLANASTIEPEDDSSEEQTKEDKSSEEETKEEKSSEENSDEVNETTSMMSSNETSTEVDTPASTSTEVPEVSNSTLLLKQGSSPEDLNRLDSQNQTNYIRHGHGKKKNGSPKRNGAALTSSTTTNTTTKNRHRMRHKNKNGPSHQDRFHFAKNYSSIFQDQNSLSVEQAKNWVLEQRDQHGGWGTDSHRALIALSLVKNSFCPGSHENDLMVKSFVVQTGVGFLKNSTKPVSPSQQAKTILAMLATCQNTKNFQGIDLTDRLRETLDRLQMLKRSNGQQHGFFVNPLVPLALCLAGRKLTSREFSTLVKMVSPNNAQDEVTRDMQSLAMMSFSCLMRTEKEQRGSYSSLMSDAVFKLLQRMKPDGSFGSVYSTALAAQALMSLDSTSSWDPASTLGWLKKQQLEDGSFGDMLATYYVLPVLSGRSMVHLKNTDCDMSIPEPDLSSTFRNEGNHFIRYSLFFGQPLENAYSIQLRVPANKSFLDIMKMAEHQSGQFKFSFEESTGDVYVYSISNVPNDSEQGMAWHLYIRNNMHAEQRHLIANEQFSGNIKLLYPRANQHLIYWFHPVRNYLI